MSMTDRIIKGLVYLEQFWPWGILQGFVIIAGIAAGLGFWGLFA